MTRTGDSDSPVGQVEPWLLLVTGFDPAAAAAFADVYHRAELGPAPDDAEDGEEGAEAGGSLWEGRILSRQADMLRVSNLVP